MTIIEAINQADELNRNTYSRKQKIVWLSRAESLIYRTVIDTHEGSSEEFAGFDPDTVPLDTALVMPQPYDEGYIHWLQAQVYYANEEIDRYNRSITMFSSCLDAFKEHYKQEHIPKGGRRFRF